MNDWKNKFGYKTVYELFFSEPEKHYEIPAYQRHFTWETSFIDELITDICSHFCPKYTDTFDNIGPYHLGSLVLAQKKNPSFYEIVDGQQRCVTLWLIIHALLKTLDPNEVLPAADKLKFSDARPLANEFLGKILKGETITDKDKKKFSEKGSTQNLLIAYHHLQKLFQNEKSFQRITGNDKITREDFKDFLLNKTQLLQTVLPPNTDVSLYFERMNDRGEQMQATDIVKAWLFEKLSPSDQSYGETIWSACSNMSRFIQSNFETCPQNSQSPLTRKNLFSDQWTDFRPEKFNVIFPETQPENTDKENNQENNRRPSIEELLKKKCVTGNKNRRNNETFVPVTDFSHLLLHALNIFEENLSKPTALNEDKLLDEFEKRKDNWKKEEVKAFLFTLFKCRYLLDTYIIKSRGIEDESWNLWRYEKTENNNQNISLVFGKENQNARYIQLLLSALHCSNSNKNYKNWLDCTLRWLYHNAPTEDIEDIEDKQKKEFICRYQMFLRSLAFLFFVKSSDSAYTDNLRKWASGNTEISLSFTMPDFEESLTYPVISVYRLNYIDYLLYEKYSEKEEFLGIKKEKLNLSTFRYSSARTSIDHFIAQTRPQGLSEDVYNQIKIHALANLSLMSSEQNTRHLNDAPIVKKDTIFGKNNADKIQKTSLSIKTLVLALIVDDLKENDSLIPNKWQCLQEKLECLISEDYKNQKLNLWI